MTSIAILQSIFVDLPRYCSIYYCNGDRKLDLVLPKKNEKRIGYLSIVSVVDTVCVVMNFGSDTVCSNTTSRPDRSCYTASKCLARCTSIEMT